MILLHHLLIPHNWKKNEKTEMWPLAHGGLPIEKELKKKWKFQLFFNFFQFFFNWWLEVIFCQNLSTLRTKILWETRLKYQKWCLYYFIFVMFYYFLQVVSILSAFNEFPRPSKPLTLCIKYVVFHILLQKMHLKVSLYFCVFLSNLCNVHKHLHNNPSFPRERTCTFC